MSYELKDNICPKCNESSLELDSTPSRELRSGMEQDMYITCKSCDWCDAFITLSDQGPFDVMKDGRIVAECLEEQLKIYKRYVNKAKLLRKTS